MTEEEKALAAAEAEAQAEKDAAIAAAIEADAAKDAKIVKLEQERDNYRKVSLKRLGKLEGDADFLGDSELSVAEQIRIALLDREIEYERKASDEKNKQLVRENAELKLALKNRPQTSIGGDSTQNVDVKDNVLSDVQITTLKAQAIRLKADPEKYIALFKENLRKKG